MKAKASIRAIRAMTICIIGLLCSTKMYADSPERADSSSVIHMIDYLQKAMRFNLYSPQEKVYLHFDNTGYFKGEYIRFKAYVTRCDTERKTDLSHVLYVELVNP
nr:hypothetical protein [Bacteroidaceae bacterium]